MILNRMLALICWAISISLTSPAPLADDAVAKFSRNASNIESITLKRRIFEDDADRNQIKQIPLSSLVGDVEKHIFTSALNFHKVVKNKDISAAEIKNKDDSEQNLNKRQLLKIEDGNIESTARTATLNDTLISQTAEKATETSGAPTHIVIDNVAIQPHIEGLALKPIFQLKHNREDEDKDASKDHHIREITISNTEATEPYPSSSSSQTTTSSTSISTSSVQGITATTTTTEAAFKTVTTSKNIEQLKEAEEELKEKFAEIEAEPIILSARV